MVPTGRGLGVGAMDSNRLVIFPFRVGLGELYSGALTFLSEVSMLSMCFLTRIFQSKRHNLRDRGKQPHSSPLTLPVFVSFTLFFCLFVFWPVGDEP